LFCISYNPFLQPIPEAIYFQLIEHPRQSWPATPSYLPAQLISLIKDGPILLKPKFPASRRDGKASSGTQRVGAAIYYVYANDFRMRLRQRKNFHTKQKQGEKW